MQEIVDGFIMEIRRGAVMLAVLSQLKKEQYGYALIQTLNDEGFKIDQGTLYPLLRRLESQKILSSSWDTGSSRPKKYYVLTDFGHDVYKELVREFNKLSKSIVNLTEGKHDWKLLYEGCPIS